MQRSVPVLGVLLVASILLNILLGVRLSRAPEVPPSPRGMSSSPRTEPAPGPESLKESLEVERKKTADLQSRIERLETDKKVLAQEAPGTSSKADRIAAFKEKLRKLKKMMSDPAFQNGGNSDPETMAELSDAMMEFYRVNAARAKDPKLYGDYFQTFFDVMVEGEGTTPTAEQSTAMNALFRGYAEELAKVPSSPAGPRLLAEIQLEGAMAPKVQSLLTEAQRAALAKNGMNDFTNLGNMGMSMNYIAKEGALDSIAQQWTAQYQLDAAQLPQAKVAAQAYLDALGRLAAEFKGQDPTMTNPGSPESYDYRLRTVREQIAALNLLQASMTTAQQERLLNQRMQEIRLYTGGQVQVTTTPEK